MCAVGASPRGAVAQAGAANMRKRSCKCLATSRPRALALRQPTTCQICNAGTALLPRDEPATDTATEPAAGGQTGSVGRPAVGGQLFVLI